MKLYAFCLATALSFSSGVSYAEEILVIMNSGSKVNSVDKKELQEFYSGESNRFDNRVAVKLSKRSDDVVRKEFYDSIDYSENQAAGNLARLQATGRSDKIVVQKPIPSSKAAIEFITINADGGISQISKSEYNSLSAADKKVVKIVYEGSSS
jgi:hypothetical protein